MTWSRENLESSNDVKVKRKKKYSLFNKLFWENWMLIHKRMKFNSYPTPLKIKSEWIKG